MATTPEVEEFGKELVELVRDLAIRSSDVMLRPDTKGPTAKRLREAAQNCTPVEFAKLVVPQVVDDAVFYLLDAIDNEHIKLSFTASNGKTVDLYTEGHAELGGWYLGKWIEKYTKERYVDDTADLKARLAAGWEPWNPDNKGEEK